MQINTLTILLYLDPGTGSLIFQTIIAIVTGVFFFFGNFKRKITSIFSPKHEELDKERE